MYKQKHDAQHGTWLRNLDILVRMCKLLKCVYTLHLTILMACSRQCIPVPGWETQPTAQRIHLLWLHKAVPSSISKLPWLASSGAGARPSRAGPGVAPARDGPVPDGAAHEGPAPANDGVACAQIHLADQLLLKCLLALLQG